MPPTRELLLARHGAAARSDGDDRERALTSQGKRDVQRVGCHLQARGWLPGAAIASPATRARVTAETMLKTAGMTCESLSIDPRIYEASAGELLAVLGEIDPAIDRPLVVGHNPAIERAVEFLGGVTASFEPGMMARLIMPDDWSALDPGCAGLADVVRPIELPEKFPYPHPGAAAVELRDRPAYYYTQSAVMPFRRAGSAIEILVIGSSSGEHVVVPKGIVEPGLTPQASAAREAREEAGVEGRVLDDPLGAFRYEKWGAACECAVFAMEVVEVIDEAQWSERHRGRAWLRPEDAERRLKHDGLRELVAALVRRVS